MSGDPDQGSEYQLDPQSLELRCGSALIHLKNKPAQLLLYLISNRNQVLSRQQISDRIWGNRVVTEDLIKDYISIIRKALADSATAPKFIETHRGKGYRYIGNIALKSFKRSNIYTGEVDSKKSTQNRWPTLYICCAVDSGSQLQNIEILSLEVISVLTKYQDIRIVDSNPAKSRDCGATNPTVGWALKLGCLDRQADCYVFAKLIHLESNSIVWLEGFDWSGFIAPDRRKTLVIGIAVAVRNALFNTAQKTREPTALNYPRDYVSLGHRLLEESVMNVTKAMQAFETALAMDSSLAEAMTGIALCYRYSYIHAFHHDLEMINEKSLIFSMDSYSLNSRETLNTLLFAQALASSGDQKAAETMHLKAMEQDPADTGAILCFGLFQCQISNSEQGVKYIRQAMSLDSKHPKSYHWALATGCYQAGELEEALIHFQLYSRLESDAIRPLHGLAATYAQLGKTGEAERTIERICKHGTELSLEAEYSYHASQTFVEKDVDKWMEGMRSAGIS